MIKDKLDPKQSKQIGQRYGKSNAEEVSCVLVCKYPVVQLLYVVILEPPPEFTWTHPHLGELSSNEEFTVQREEYQGGSVTTLVIHHAKNSDAGTYSLTATNRNGSEKVDLDLIVLDTLPECDCFLFLKLDKQCSCAISYTG